MAGVSCNNITKGYQMIDDIIKIVQLIFDKDRWLQLSEMLEVVSRKNNQWQKEVKCTKGTFRGNEAHKVSPFLNDAIQQIRESGASENQLANFARVFNELMDNAFRHGCNRKRSGKINVACFFCRWFIHLEITDNGPGFEMSSEIRRARQATRARGVGHGLDVVDTLSYEFHTNKKGNSVTAILSAQEHFEVVPVLEHFDDHEILTVAILSDDAWYDTNTDWSPVLHAIENAAQNLILVDLSEIYWPSAVVISAVDTVSKRDKKIKGYPKKDKNRFAFLINKGARGTFGLENYEDATPPIFRDDQRQQAMQWLVNGEDGKGTTSYRDRTPHH
jgi:anti-sigma regulatory factor (Ser/Thr protein kinase)